jgi:3-hydroxyacyl-CoA dehydrogenase
MALGGGCEFVMHSQRAWWRARELHRLWNRAWGCCPGGGLKESPSGAGVGEGRRCAAEIRRVQADRHGETRRAPRSRASGASSSSRRRDLPSGELLYVAKAAGARDGGVGRAPALAPAQIPVLGDTGIATLKMMLVNMKEGGFISGHDYEIARASPTRSAAARWSRERGRREVAARPRAQHFVELAKTPKTQERIEFMLKNGKPAAELGQGAARGMNFDDPARIRNASGPGSGPWRSCLCFGSVASARST